MQDTEFNENVRLNESRSLHCPSHYYLASVIAPFIRFHKINIVIIFFIDHNKNKEAKAQYHHRHGHNERLTDIHLIAD